MFRAVFTILFLFVFLNAPQTTVIYTLSLHDALPISVGRLTLLQRVGRLGAVVALPPDVAVPRSEEHTSELQSLRHLVCPLLLEKKKKGRRPENGRSTQQ